MYDLFFDTGSMIEVFGNAVFVIAPVFGYLPQILTGKIVFSPILSFILINGNILKLLYHRIDPLTIPLISQAIFLILLQLYILYNFKQRFGYTEELIYKNRYVNRIFENLGLFNFHLGATIIILATLQVFSIIYPGQIFLMCGYIGVAMESIVGVVQILMTRVDKSKNLHKIPKRIPKELFAFWIAGDFLKIIWMVYKLKSPNAFIFPIVFQILIDTLLLFE